MTNDNPPVWLTWAEFKEEVLKLLPVDRRRVGPGIQDADGQEGYLTATIKQGCIDVQQFVPRYRAGHESIYWPDDDFVAEGSASRGVLPQNAMIRDVWFWIETSKTRYPVVDFPYDRRFELVNGLETLPDNQARIAKDPLNYTFYIYPAVADGAAISIFWDGIKTDFEDDEQTPFDRQMAGAVADYLKGRIMRDIEKDNAGYATYMHPQSGSYIVKRTNLYLGLTS